MPAMSLYPVESGDTCQHRPAFTYCKYYPDIIRFYLTGDGLHTYRSFAEWNIAVLWDMTVTQVEFRYDGQTNPVTDNGWIYSMEIQPSIQPFTNAGKAIIWHDSGDGTAYLNNDAVFPEVGNLRDVGGASGPAWDTDPVIDLQAAVDAKRSWFALGFRNSEVTPGDLTGIYSERKSGVNPFPTLYVEYEVTVGPPPPEPPPVDPDYGKDNPDYVSPPAPTKSLTSNKHVKVPFLPYRIYMSARRGRILKHVTRRVRA